MNIYRLTDHFAFSDFPTERDRAQYSDYSALMTLSKKRPSEAVIEAFPEYRYCHMPDGKNVPVEQVAHAVGIIRTWLKDGRKVLVHCYGGRNRSGLVAAMVLMDTQGLNGKEALLRIDSVSRKRGGGPRALTNPYYRAFLELVQ